MADNPSLTPKNLFAEYVRRRKSGQSPDEILQALLTPAKLLTRQERKRLSAMIGKWESSEGKRHPVSDDRSHPSRAKTPQEDAVICPNCGKPNPKQAVHCYACGHVLIPPTGTSSTRQLENGDELGADDRWGSAYFGSNTTLVLEVRGSDRPIEVKPAEDVEIVIGRSARDSVLYPDVDLVPYGAEEAGVSRLHATLKRQGNTITITDMNSVNHTYINGQQLHPHEVRVLRDGDELRLGRLVIQVRFKREIKPLPGMGSS